MLLRVKLCGVYGDGSNVMSLGEDALCERVVQSDDDDRWEVLVEAREACRGAQSRYDTFIFVVEEE